MRIGRWGILVKDRLIKVTRLTQDQLRKILTKKSELYDFLRDITLNSFPKSNHDPSFFFSQPFVFLSSPRPLPRPLPLPLPPPPSPPPPHSTMNKFLFLFLFFFLFSSFFSFSFCLTLGGRRRRAVAPGPVLEEVETSFPDYLGEYRFPLPDGSFRFFSFVFFSLIFFILLFFPFY